MNPALRDYQKSFVLLSGGIDSTTCLAIADYYHKMNGGTVEAISIDYGQRHVKETKCAKEIAASYGYEHSVLDCKNVVGKTMLTDPSVQVPDVSYDNIVGISPTYVPFRNGFMLARLAVYAQEYVNHIKALVKPESDTALEDLVTLYFGAHAEDAKNWAYPDCTPEFIGAMQNAIYIGTYRTVRLLTPLAYLGKDQIISWGDNLGVDYSKTWSCYKGEELQCGACPTCYARKAAFEKAGVEDPTQYAA